MKILVCEDEYATRLITKSYLDMHSFETIEASNGKEALEIIEEETPDLVIVDYSLPDMTGLEVIKKLNGSIPAIVLTSGGFTEATEKELREYAAGYLVKPVIEEHLIEAVNRAAGKK